MDLVAFLGQGFAEFCCNYPASSKGGVTNDAYLDLLQRLGFWYGQKSKIDL